MREADNLVPNKEKRSVGPKFILIFFLVVSLFGGYFLASDYGMSWDIRYQIMLGKYNQEYISLENFLDPPPFEIGGLNIFYGPIHEIFIQNVSSFFQKYQLRGTELQIYYWINFSSFLLGMIFFYNLARRYMRAWASLVSTLLLFSQPVLFGHAFINSKDIPFMVFFMGSITLGLIMVDRIGPSLEATIITNHKIHEFALSEWKKNNTKRKRFTKVFAWAWSIAVFTRIVFWSLLVKWLEIIITKSMIVGDENIFGQLFLRIAQNISLSSLDAYIHKGTILLSRFMTRGFLLGFLFLGIMVITLLPETIKKIWGDVLQVYVSEFFSKSFLKKILSFLINPWIFIAGLIVGITASIRILGPTAVGLVGIVFIWQKKEKALAPLVAYILIGSIITYFTWPLLWSTGFYGVVKVISVMTDFPWSGTVLFDGQYYLASKLPYSYFPKLLAIQFTEPIVIGFVVGIPLLVWLKRGKRISSSNLSLLILWFLVPLFGVMFLHLTLFDNFRHFLFILPPIFIVTGIGLDCFFRKTNLKWLNTIVALIILLPGAFAIITMHPYEYVYYNSFVGGIGETFRQFEMDYWATSTDEATEFINQHAIPNAKIVVAGPYQNVEYYAREDLQIFDLDKVKENSLDDYDYAILLTRDNADLKYATDSPTIFQVERKGAVFVVVRELNQ